MTPLVHLASRLYGTPLLIARAKLDTLLAVLGPRIGLMPADLAPPAIAVPAPTTPPTLPGIAVIPIHGTLVRRAIGLEAASGLTSYARIAADLDAALADPGIAGILLEIDSPGGEAGGVFELGERIRAAAHIKPIWAHAGDNAFSAAYALGAAAQHLTVARTGGVGSIGVIALHVDQSIRNAQDGLHITALYAGAHKNDATPHAPLTTQATDALQTEIDRLYALFVDHVAAMRNLEADAVRATEAALYFGEDAVAAGLADAVAPFDDTLAAFARSLAPALPTRPRLQVREATSFLSPPELSMSDPVASSQAVSSRPDAPDPATATTLSTTTVAPSDTHNGAHDDAQTIAELCLLAGSPERTAEFLAAHMNAGQVRQVLLQARAEQVEIASHHVAGHAPGSMNVANTTATAANPLLDAVRRRIASTPSHGG